MHRRFVILDYDPGQFPFHLFLAHSVFRVRQLDQLHVSWMRRTGKAMLDYADNLRARRVMQELPDDSPFYAVYHAWVAKVLAPHYGGRVRYSAHPKMRVHFAGTGCVSDFHCDAEVTGRDDQINCYLPFTDVSAGGTVWCEADYNSGEYVPLDLRYGQALLWDGGRLRHGTFANQTGRTRVSCDFRFVAREPARVAPPWSDILSDRPVLAGPLASFPESAA